MNREQHQNKQFVKDHLRNTLEKMNDFKIATKKDGSTLAHEIKKLKICFDLKQRGLPFYTECEILDPITKKVKRADIIDIFNREVIEIQDSEPDSSIKDKNEFYSDLGFNFSRYKTNGFSKGDSS